MSSPRTRQTRFVAIALAAALLATACSGDSDDGAATTGPAGSVPLVSSQSSAVPAQPGDASQPTSGSPITSPASPAPPPPPVPPAGLDAGKGVFDDSIVLGWEGLGDSTGAAVDSVGVSVPTASEAEQKRSVNTIVEHINARGGIGGKRVEMVFHFVDVTQGTHDSRGAEACAYFTEDHDVFAVVMNANHSHAFTKCLAQRQTPLIDVSGSLLPHDEHDLAAHAPYLYLPIRVNPSRFEAYIDALADQGFFDPDAKVGLLRYDWSTHERIRDEALQPAMAARGVELTDEFAFSVVQSIGDLSLTASQANNAVLRFRSKGINRLLFLPSAWVIPTIWPAAAESQGYRARYGLNSWEGLDNLASNAPAAQLEGAIGLGWQPDDDVPVPQAVEILRANPNWGHCAEAVTAAGLSEEIATLCTPFLFLQEAMARAPALTPLGLRAGADQLGGTPYSNQTFGTLYGPGRFDGAAEGRRVAFDASCGCFAYTGGLLPIP